MYLPKTMQRINENDMLTKQFVFPDASPDLDKN